MNYFPNGDEEISLLRFIASYQYLNISDAKYFFSTQTYYKRRITHLISKKFLRRIKRTLVLGEFGIEYAKLFNFEYHALNRNPKYLSRLLYISSLGSFFYNCKNVSFIPSFNLKDKETFTATSRKFIGVLEINTIEYLVYHITTGHDNRYIHSIIYDLQKEKSYKNIIILANDIERLNINDFAFGMNKVLILDDTEENREKLKYLHSIDWSRVIKDNYKNNVHLAEYIFCDYTNYKDKYISTFYFLDTEKITKIKYFLAENKQKNVDIVCGLDIKDQLQKELPNCNYITVDLDKYINKEHIVYD